MTENRKQFRTPQRGEPVAPPAATGPLHGELASGRPAALCRGLLNPKP